MADIFFTGSRIGKVHRKYSDAFDESPGEGGAASFLGNAFDLRKVFTVGAIAGAIILVLLLRLTNLQLAHGGDYRALAEGNRLRRQAIPAKRGLIRDRNGVLLAENVPSFYLSLIPADLPPEPKEREDLLLHLADTTGLQPKDIEDELRDAGHDETVPVIVRQELPHDTALKLIVEYGGREGVNVEVGMRRSYPQTAASPSLSHVLGYSGRLTDADIKASAGKGYLRSDLIGKTGLESSYETTLRGIYGSNSVEVDAGGTVDRLIATTPKTDGSSLKLTIDSALQSVSEKALVAAIKQLGARRGAVVVEDPRNGQILSLVSWPSFDNNQFAKGITSASYDALANSSDHPLYARAVAGEYPPGSTVKIVYAGAALAEGIITPATTVLSTGGLKVGAWFFPDWKAGGHGIVDVRKAIANSVNTFFYYVSGGFDSFKGLGITKLGEYARRFGLGERLGIDLPGEGSGFFPTPAWKESAKHEVWYIGDTYHAGIGQGDVLATPLQVAAYTSAIANGGRLYSPRTVLSTIDPDGRERTLEPVVVRDNLLPTTAVKTVQAGMRDAVTIGSARALSTLDIDIAGKTGTAQFSSTKPPHAWFTGFAPYRSPEITVTVLIEEGVEGSTSAVPVAKAIFDYWQNRGKEVAETPVEEPLAHVR